MVVVRQCSGASPCLVDGLWVGCLVLLKAVPYNRKNNCFKPPSMQTTSLPVSPNDNIQTVLQKLDASIQQADAEIEAATAKRLELLRVRESLANLLPTEAVEPLANSNGAAPVDTGSVDAPLPARSTNATGKEAGNTTQPAKTPTVAKPAAKTAEAKPEAVATPPRRSKTTTAAKASASPTAKPTPAAAKSSSAKQSSVKTSNTRRYHEAAGIPKGTPLPEAIATVLASQPDQALATTDVVRRLYGTLKATDHAAVTPLVQQALTAGLRQGLWGRVGQKPATYQQLPPA